MRGWSGDLVMNHTAMIGHNWAKNGHGGGVYSNGGEIEILGQSVVNSNRAIDGGGIFSTTEGAKLTTSKETSITKNHALGAGGGVHATNCLGNLFGTIGHNVAYKGGGVYFLGSWVTLGGSISGNSAETQAGGIGLDASSELTLVPTEIRDNKATGNGGGLVIFDPASQILATAQITFQRNVAEGSGGCLVVSALASLVATTGFEFHDCSAGDRGGAILVQERATFRLEDAVVSHGRALRGGAFAIDSGATVTAKDCDIRKGRALEIGGAVYAENGATVSFQKTIFRQNEAVQAGGIAVLGAHVETISSLFDGTTATQDGGVFYLANDGSLSAENTTFRQSAATAGGLLYFDHTTVARPTDVEASLQETNKVDGLTAVYGTLLASGVASIVASHDPNVLEVGGSKAHLLAPVEVRAFDSLGQLVETASGTVEISGVSDSPLFDLDGETKFEFEKGIASTRTLTILDAPNATVTLVAASFTDLISTFNVRLRPCKDGEVISTVDHVTCLPCEAYTYFDRSRSECRPCEDGMECLAETALEDRLLETLVIEKGYWRASIDSDKVERCFTSVNCPGGRGAGTDLCGSHASGTLCNECQNGYYLTRSFKCRPCAGTWIVAILILLIGVATAFFELRFKFGAMTFNRNDVNTQRSFMTARVSKGLRTSPSKRASILVADNSNRPADEATVHATSRAWWSKSLLFMYLSFQTMGVFAKTEGIVLAWPFQEIIAASSTLTDFSGITACAAHLDYFDNLFVSTMTPIFLGGLLIFAAVVRILVADHRHSYSRVARRAERHHVTNQHAQAWVYLMLILHTPTCVNLNAFFDCDGPFETSSFDDDVYVLRTDYSVRCNGDRYKAWWPFAMVMLCFYVLVVPGLFLVRLWSVRNSKTDVPAAIQRHRDGALVALTSRYRSKFWYWELLVLTVRLVCCGLLSQVIGKQSLRLAAASFVAIAYLFLCSILEPLGRGSSLGRIFAMCNYVVALMISLGSITKLGGDEHKNATPIALTLMVMALLATIAVSARHEAVSHLVVNIVTRRPFTAKTFLTLYSTNASMFLVAAVDRAMERFFDAGSVTDLAYFQTYLLPLEGHWSHQTLLAEVLECDIAVLRRRAAAYTSDDGSWVTFVFGPLADHVRALSAQAGDDDLVENDKNVDEAVLLAHDVKNPPLATYREALRLRAFDQAERIKASMADHAVSLNHSSPFSIIEGSDIVAQPALASDSALVRELRGVGTTDDDVMSRVLASLAGTAYQRFTRALLDKVPGSHICSSSEWGYITDVRCNDDDGDDTDASRCDVVPPSTKKVQVSLRVFNADDDDDDKKSVVFICDPVPSAESLAQAGDVASNVNALTATCVCKDLPAIHATYNLLTASSGPLRVVNVVDNLAANVFPYDIKLVCQFQDPNLAHPLFCQILLTDIDLARQSKLFTCYNRLIGDNAAAVTAVVQG